jgi:hypothetical protein
MMSPKAGPNKFLHRVGGLMWGAARGDTENTVPAVFGLCFRKSFGRFFQCLIPFNLLEGAVGLFYKWFFEPVFVLDEVVGELTLDTESPLVGWTVHRGLRADNFVPFGHKINRTTDSAIRADSASLFDWLWKGFGADSLLVGKSSGGAGLDTLSAEGAI